MVEFTSARGGSVRYSFDEDESEILRRLIEEMRLLLEADIPRMDPVIARLFPAAYEEASDEEAYRELTGSQLEESKLAALQSVSRALGTSGPVMGTLDPEEASEWLTLLNDIRLAIGARLEVTEDKMGLELDPADPEGPAYSVMHWLGWVQESILRELHPPASGTEGS